MRLTVAGEIILFKLSVTWLQSENGLPNGGAGSGSERLKKALMDELTARGATTAMLKLVFHALASG